MLITLIFLFLKYKKIREFLLNSIIYKLFIDAKIIFASPILFFETVFLSLIIHILLSFVVWKIAVDLGAQFDFFNFVLLWSIVLIISMIPISIAGWGLREGSMVFAFHILDSSPSIAVTTSVLFGLLSIIFSVPGGLILFLSVFQDKDLLFNKN